MVILSLSLVRVDLYLPKYRNQFAIRKRTGTLRSKIFLNMIPINEKDFKSEKIGNFQIETSASSGNYLSGLFIWILKVKHEFSG
jgi:hypothetical protein